MKMYLINVAKKKFKSACAIRQSDQSSLSGPWEIYLAEGRHLEQSVRLRSSVRVFAVASFQEMLIKHLFFSGNEANIYDRNAV